MNLVYFSYINSTKIAVSDRALYLNSSWVHPSKDNKWDTHFVWELDVIQKFAEQIQDNFVILDIGANTGTFSLAAKYYPTTKWHLFEPDPFNFSLLKENLKVNNIDNVILYEEALGNKIGDSVLKICPTHRGLNTIGTNVKRFSESESINHPIKIDTIDNLFLNTRIDLIKMDTEGSEYDIIMGGIETIKKYKPKILLEYNAGNMSQCGHSMEELDRLIEKINYEKFWFDNGENLFIQSR